MKGQAAGQAFLQGVLSKITDPEQRAAATTLFNNPTIQTEIGNGVLGQSEVDRQLQELTQKTAALQEQEAALTEKHDTLQTWEEGLKSWRGERISDLEELDARRKGTYRGANGNGNGGQPPVAQPQPGTITQQVLDEALKTNRNEMQGAFLGYQVDQNQLYREHFKLFGEILDVETLLRHPQIHELGLKGVYQVVHKDALAAKTAETAKAAEEKIRADERQKVLAENAQHPYLMPDGVGSGSPLDGLGKTTQGSLVDQAAAEYSRLQQGRMGGAR